MVARSETFVITPASRLVLGVAFVLGLGAAVAASPVRPSIVTSVMPQQSMQAAFDQVSFKPLGEGPSIAVQKSFGCNDEDCVTVTQVKGVDGRVYPTRGMVCR